MTSKQKTFRSTYAICRLAALFPAVWISCIGPPIRAPFGMVGRASAQSKVTSTFGKEVASLRLIAAPGLSNGRYDAGIAISMAPMSHTYWQQPGEAGVPPVFSFNGSVNVAKADVRFPTPARISEEGIEAFGYTDKVVFPVLVTPADPAKPAVLDAVVDYAVCNKICIPAHGTATITLAPGGKGLDGTAVAAALAKVPVALPAAEHRDLTITREPGADKPTWTVVWSGKQPIDDVFAVAPAGFYFETKKVGPGKFSLTALEIVAASATARVPVTLTLARPGGGLVTSETLDVPGVGH